MPDSSAEARHSSSATEHSSSQRRRTQTRRDRNRRTRSRSHSSASRVARSMFFAGSGVWGFVIGVATIAWSMQQSGTPLDLDLSSSTYLVPGAAIAGAGGILVAAAYREMRRRLR